MGERRALGNPLDNVDLVYTHLVPARRALFGTNFPRDDDAGLLRQAFQVIERVG